MSAPVVLSLSMTLPAGVRLLALRETPVAPSGISLDTQVRSFACAAFLTCAAVHYLAYKR